MTEATEPRMTIPEMLKALPKMTREQTELCIVRLDGLIAGVVASKDMATETTFRSCQDKLREHLTVATAPTPAPEAVPAIVEEAPGPAGEPEMDGNGRETPDPGTDFPAFAPEDDAHAEALAELAATPEKFATPKALALAKAEGIDLTRVSADGKRVTASDVRVAMKKRKR